IGCLLIEKLQIDEVRNLFDIGDRICHATCPEDVGDVVQLSADLLIHFASGTPSCRQILRASTSAISVCRGTVRIRLGSARFMYRVWFAPSLRSAHPWRSR